MAQNSPLLFLYRWLRWPLLLVAVTGLLFFAAWRLTRVDILRLDDTVEYWASGRLNATGQNPYDPALLLPLERAAGRPLEEPVIMWNPPWVLALVMPLGLLPYPLARALWFLLHFFTVAVAGVWLIRETDGSPPLARQGLAVLFGLSFGPTLYALRMGQITPLMLLGLTGFLSFSRRQRWIATGVVTALALIKPHLLYLFLAAVILDALTHGRWGVLLGLVGALALSAGLATMTNPLVWEQYVYAATHYPPRHFVTTTLGAYLRLFFGAEHFWLQFLPPGLGLLWLFFYWHRHHRNWEWEQRLPLLVLVSVTTAAYNWGFDLVVILIALIPALLRLLDAWRHPAAMALMAAYLVLNIISVFTIFYGWIAPFFLVWYLLARQVQIVPPVSGEMDRGVFRSTTS